MWKKTNVLILMKIKMKSRSHIDPIQINLGLDMVTNVLNMKVSQCDDLYVLSNT